MTTETDQRLEHFCEAVRLLGGTRETARLLEIQDRSLLRLMNGTAELHDGFIRDIAERLADHLEQCNAAGKHLLALLSTGAD